jgi:hypothetical protein
MDARELRIGNLVLFNDAIKKIAVINEISIAWYNEDKNQYFTHLGCCVSLGLIQPIPLTEQWLVKLRFEEYKEMPLPFSDRKAWFIGEENKMFIWSSGFVFKRLPDGFIIIAENINQVHKLQNLYFALISEELTIKS